MALYQPNVGLYWTEPCRDMSSGTFFSLNLNATEKGGIEIGETGRGGVRETGEGLGLVLYPS